MMVRFAGAGACASSRAFVDAVAALAKRHDIVGARCIAMVPKR